MSGISFQLWWRTLNWFGVFMRFHVMLTAHINGAKAAAWTLSPNTVLSLCVLLFNSSSTSFVHLNALVHLKACDADPSCRFGYTVSLAVLSRHQETWLLATQKKQSITFSVTWLLVFPVAIFLPSHCIPFHWNCNWRGDLSPWGSADYTQPHWGEDVNAGTR